MKEEKLKLLRQHQEERIKKSLERAKAEPKKIVSCSSEIYSISTTHKIACDITGRIHSVKSSKFYLVIFTYTLNSI